MNYIQRTPSCPIGVRTCFAGDIDPLTRYAGAYYAAQMGITLKPKAPASRTYLIGLLDALERMKSAIGDNDAVHDESAASAYVENFALKVFAMADNEDRRGEATRYVSCHSRRDCFLLFNCSALLHYILHATEGRQRSSSPPPTSSRSSVHSTKRSQTQCLPLPIPPKRRYGTRSGKPQTSPKHSEKAASPPQGPRAPSSRSPFLQSPRQLRPRLSLVQPLLHPLSPTCQVHRRMGSSNSHHRRLTFRTNCSHIPSLARLPPYRAPHGAQLPHLELPGDRSTLQRRGLLTEFGSVTS